MRIWDEERKLLLVGFAPAEIGIALRGLRLSQLAEDLVLLRGRIVVFDAGVEFALLLAGNFLRGAALVRSLELE